MGFGGGVGGGRVQAGNTLKHSILSAQFCCVHKNSINCQVKKKIGNVIQAKLRVVTQEADFQKALRTTRSLRNQKASRIHFQDKVLYMKMNADILQNFAKDA